VSFDPRPLAPGRDLRHYRAVPGFVGLGRFCRCWSAVIVRRVIRLPL